MSRDARYYDRVRLPDDKLLPCEGLDQKLQGQVAIVGLGGAFIRTRESLPVGTVFTVRIRAGGEVVETMCTVRDVVTGGLGVEFVELRGQHEQTLKGFLGRLKS